jgi:hypothetical protein
MLTTDYCVPFENFDAHYLLLCIFWNHCCSPLITVHWYLWKSSMLTTDYHQTFWKHQCSPLIIVYLLKSSLLTTDYCAPVPLEIIKAHHWLPGTFWKHWCSSLIIVYLLKLSLLTTDYYAPVPFEIINAHRWLLCTFRINRCSLLITVSFEIKDCCSPLISVHRYL